MSKPIAFISGSARRIGAHIARYLHQQQINVIIHCHLSKNDGQALVDQMNAKRADSAWLIQQDLCTPQAVDSIMSQINTLGLSVTYLINNASVFIKNKTSLADMASWETQFHLNVKMPYQLSLALRPMLATNQGSIVNLTDIHSRTPLQDYAIYCQSKAALWMQTKALAKSFAPEIRVNAVAPGAIAWPEQANTLSNEKQQAIIDKTWLKKHGHPDYIAQAVFQMLTNPFITGQQLRVDGGRY